MKEDELKSYLKGDLSPMESHELERLALHSELEGDALEGWEANNPDQISDDLHILRTRLAAKRTSNNNGLWLKVAAVGLLLIVAGYLTWFFTNKTVETSQVSMVENEIDSVSLSKESVSNINPGEENTVQSQEELPADKNEEEQHILDEEKTLAFLEESTVEEKIIENVEAEYVEATPPKMESIGLDETALTMSETAQEELVVYKPETTQMLTGKAAGVNISDQLFSESKAVARSSASMPEIMPKRKIKGVVMDQDMEPLPGVSIVVDGTSRGTVSNIDGEFEIEVNPEDEELVFAFIGFSTTERQIPDQDSLTVALQMDLMALEEVVVVGYGARNKGESAYSQIQIENDDFSTYQKPQPADGMTSFKDYINQNKIYPQAAAENEISGVVKLELKISSSGEVVNIEVKKSLGFGCDAEAIRLIKEGPKWIPANSGGQNIESNVTLKIKFP